MKKITDVSKVLPVKGTNGKMDLKKVNVLVVHHDAVYVPANGYNTMERLKMEANDHIARGWSHISYHYVIDNLGDIYKCLPEDEVAYHCGNLAINKNSLAVKLDGNFEIQKPTAAQVKSLGDFIVWITSQRPDIPKIVKSSIKGHFQIKSTACPGRNLKPYLKKY